MWKRIVCVTLVLAGFAVARVSAKELNVGDAAPKLEVKEFVKGNPVTSLQKGKMYVVEFWATWCGPCRTSIPHLTQLQKKHKDVTFIGVSVFERAADQSAVKPFVEQMGDKMDYRVATDSIPEGGKPNDGKMAKEWMEAAGQGGIPTAFIVNKEGQVAWIGHPMQMEKPLQQVVDGSWDLKAAATEFKEAQAKQRKLRELSAKLNKARRDKDSKAIVAIVDEAVADDPKLEMNLGMLKYTTLAAEADMHDKAVEYGKHLVDDVLKNNAQGLNALAWSIVEPPKKPDAKFAKLALAAAKRADEVVNGKDGAIADTLALAYFTDGDPARALETQQRAMKLAEGTRLKDDASMKERLEQYRKAMKQDK